jgi:hypothetical protein
MTTGKQLGLTALASASLTAAVLANPVLEGGRRFTTTMTGAAEVPGPGDPDGSGTASVTVNHGQKRVCYELAVANIDPATAAHIHFAPVGVAGGVVVPLSPPAGTPATSSGCVEVTATLAKAILKNPAGYYVNVHNAAFPAGAVRGQLAKPNQ